MYLCKLVRSVKMKQQIDTEIQFSGLKPGSYGYHYTLNSDFFKVFENENLSDGEVNFEVKLEKKERLLILNFTFSGRVRTICDRCLGDLEVPVEGEQTLCVKFSDSEESDDEDIVILPEKAYKIDLAQWMYEYVVIAMPMQCIHPDDPEGNPTCDPEMLKYISESEEGAEETQNELSIDPRWAKLNEIK